MYVQSKSDYSLFTCGSGNSFVVILLYVDDIIVAGLNSVVINEVKAFLHSKFKVKDLGPLIIFLELRSPDPLLVL